MSRAKVIGPCYRCGTNVYQEQRYISDGMIFIHEICPKKLWPIPKEPR